MKVMQINMEESECDIEWGPSEQKDHRPEQTTKAGKRIECIQFME